MFRPYCRILFFFIAVIIISAQAILVAKKNSKISIDENKISVLTADNVQQSQMIASQSLSFERFNEVSRYTNHLNSLIDIGDEETVSKYREKLRYEKTCNFPIPAHIANELLQKTSSIRADAMRTDTRGFGKVDDSPITTSRLTYCQTLLWIAPLLAEIEKGNNQLRSIAKINGYR